ncbi:rhoptry kinase family protein rop35 [Cystoisospora suis]|uniref:Rhoptry kinase family protein rop35 n=1 Tax=Cystoisospora suis TaxID=483139 RepID=A0A2C6KIB8_9APIC|nr:rhoptry kinase family protein rop35 [Cystoisospora suis]
MWLGRRQTGASGLRQPAFVGCLFICSFLWLTPAAAANIVELENDAGPSTTTSAGEVNTVVMESHGAPHSVGGRNLVRQGLESRRLTLFSAGDKAIGAGGGLLAALGAVGSLLTFLYGSPKQALKRLRLRVKKHVPWSWRRFMAKLPEIDEESFSDFPEVWPRSRRRFMVMLLPRVSAKLAAFLKLKPSVRKHGIAIKAFKIDPNRNPSSILNEVNAHMNMAPKSPFILPVLGAYRGKSGKAVYMIMPRLRADMHKALKVAKRSANIKLALAEMVYALKRMHDFGFVHRDIKLLNYFVNFQGHVVLADFEGAWDKTLWLHLDDDYVIYTEGFLAPEIDLGQKNDWVKFSEKTDLYALGICFKHVLAAVGSETPDADKLRVLVNMMTKRNPEDRYTVQQVMKSPYFKEINFALLEEQKQGVPFPGDFESSTKFA